MAALNAKHARRCLLPSPSYAPPARKWHSAIAPAIAYRAHSYQRGITWRAAARRRVAQRHQRALTRSMAASINTVRRHQQPARSYRIVANATFVCRYRRVSITAYQHQYRASRSIALQHLMALSASACNNSGVSWRGKTRQQRISAREQLTPVPAAAAKNRQIC